MPALSIQYLGIGITSKIRFATWIEHSAATVQSHDSRGFVHTVFFCGIKIAIDLRALVINFHEATLNG
jgi:hypothetical protein